MINQGENVVIVVGAPDSGKTHLSQELEIAYPDHKVYHTDDYIPHGFEQGLYELMKDIERDSPKKMIVEGILGFRLLRKWEQHKTSGPYPDHYLNPDLVIYTQRTPREHRKDASDYTMRSQRPIWDQWYYLPGRHQPRIVYHK